MTVFADLLAACRCSGCVINSTKTQPALFSTFGLWFGDDFALCQNIAETLTYRQRHLPALARQHAALRRASGPAARRCSPPSPGYGLAKYRFPGRARVFAVVLGAVAVPGTALAVPTFLLFSQLRPHQHARGRSSSRR